MDKENVVNLFEIKGEKAFDQHCNYVLRVCHDLIMDAFNVSGNQGLRNISYALAAVFVCSPKLSNENYEYLGGGDDEIIPKLADKFYDFLKDTFERYGL